MALTCYPVAGKKKSFDICLAFARGSNGQIAGMLREGEAFFYGVDGSNIETWRRVRELGRDFYYCDNAYFDGARQRYFRITRNALQHSGLGRSDGTRLAKLQVTVKPWRRSGTHVLVCPQSASFMRTVIGFEGDWPGQTLANLAAVTDRPVRMRAWSADKGAMAATIQQDLEDAHVLVTWSSAAAVTAILAGVPAIVLGECAAAPMAATSIDQLENPPTPDGREEWAAVLADNQWTLDEMRAGTAWRALQASQQE